MSSFLFSLVIYSVILSLAGMVFLRALTLGCYVKPTAWDVDCSLVLSFSPAGGRRVRAFFVFGDFAAVGWVSLW